MASILRPKIARQLASGEFIASKPIQPELPGVLCFYNRWEGSASLIDPINFTLSSPKNGEPTFGEHPPRPSDQQCGEEGLDPRGGAQEGMEKLGTAGKG